MPKTIIVLTGNSYGKNRFSDWLKRNGYEDRVWNVNPLNVLALVARKYFYWEGERDSNFYAAMQELIPILDKRFDFRYAHVSKVVDDFNAKPDDGMDRILVVHKLDGDKRIIEYDGALTIHIAKDQTEYDKLIQTTEYDKVILSDKDFDKNVKFLIDVLLSKKEN